MQSIRDLINALAPSDDNPEIKTLGDAVLMVDGNLNDIYQVLDQIAGSLSSIDASLEELVRLYAQR